MNRIEEAKDRLHYLDNHAFSDEWGKYIPPLVHVAIAIYEQIELANKPKAELAVQAYNKGRKDTATKIIAVCRQLIGNQKDG